MEELGVGDDVKTTKLRFIFTHNNYYYFKKMSCRLRRLQKVTILYYYIYIYDDVYRKDGKIGYLVNYSFFLVIHPVFQKKNFTYYIRTKQASSNVTGMFYKGKKFPSYTKFTLIWWKPSCVWEYVNNYTKFM